MLDDVQILAMIAPEDQDRLIKNPQVLQMRHQGGQEVLIRVDDLAVIELGVL